MNSAKWVVPALALSCPMLLGQTYDELSIFRNRPLPWADALQVKGGMIGSIASEENEFNGNADEIGWDGHVYYHQSKRGSDTGIEAYAGRDGAIGSYRNDTWLGNQNILRLEGGLRYFPFWREGYYDSDDTFNRSGSYEGSDYDGYVGFGRRLDQDFLIEFGPYVHGYDFESTGKTPDYVPPDSFQAYGARIFFEHNTAEFARTAILPTKGFVATVVVEREWNNSESEFGSLFYQSVLPNAVWRGRGKRHWYVPTGSSSIWEILLDASFADETDRVVTYDAYKPLLGHTWGDGQLRLRFDVGSSFSIAPFVQLQYTQVLEEDGQGSDKLFFFGGGAEMWLNFSDALSLNAWYSYLNNESRPPVSTTEDVYGEHMFFVGMVLRFTGVRR